MVLPVIIVAAIALLAIFLLLNKKSVIQEREGLVKEILNKDVFVIDFGAPKPSLVKFFGISVASENEMMDDKIFDFLNERMLGQYVRVNPKRIDTGDIIMASIHTTGGEYVNALMVQQGFARWSPTEAADDRELGEAQEQAKTNQAGIWNPAVRSLVEERMRKQAAEDMSDEDIANMSVNPEDLETKEYQDD